MSHKKDESRWQSFLPSTKDRIAYLRNAGPLSDITITFPAHPQVIKAHRLILAMSSPVFEAMLYGPLAEGDTLSLPEEPPAAFTWLLDYMYRDDATLTNVPLAIQVYYLATKYQMDTLSRHCSKFLRQHVNADTAAVVCEVALMLQDDELLAQVVQTLETCSDEVLLSPYFPSLGASTLLHLLTHLPLVPSSEVVIFRALLKCS